MRTTARLAFTLLLSAPAWAHAYCYSIYDANNHLSFQSTVSPIDLSQRISDAMAQRFPGRHLVITPDTSDCREVRASSEPNRPRVTAPGQPSPMLSNVETETATPSPRRSRARR